MRHPAERIPAQVRRGQRRSQPADLPPGEGRTAKPAHTQVAAAVCPKLVRRSVDLSPAYHAMLTEWCAKTAEEIGVTRVTGQDVIRALVARLLMDQALSRRIRADLRMNT